MERAQHARAETRHEPVMLAEILTALKEGRQEQGKRWWFMFDGTLGGGGHSEAILRSDDAVVLVAMDRDEQALTRARSRLRGDESRAVFLRGNFAELHKRGEEIQEALRTKLPPDVLPERLAFDGMLLDLGISSDQLDDAERGFSFLSDAPLDMRVDKQSTLSASDVLNEYTLPALEALFRRAGLGAKSRALSRAIIGHRPLTSTAQFAAVCEQVIHPSNARKHPATVPFMAIRAEVNREFANLEEFLDHVPQLLAPQGVLAVLCFHSLEDQLVARRMREWSRAVPAAKGLPDRRAPLGELLTKKSCLPAREEVARNPRARSARLRVFRRVPGGKS